MARWFRILDDSLKISSPTASAIAAISRNRDRILSFLRHSRYHDSGERGNSSRLFRRNECHVVGSAKKIAKSKGEKFENAYLTVPHQELRRSSSREDFRMNANPRLETNSLILEVCLRDVGSAYPLRVQRCCDDCYDAANSLLKIKVRETNQIMVVVRLQTSKLYRDELTQRNESCANGKI